MTGALIRAPVIFFNFNQHALSQVPGGVAFTLFLIAGNRMSTMKKILLLLVCAGSILKLYPQQGELEYFRSIYSESEVREYIERAYTNKLVNHLTEAGFDQVRTKVIGASFNDPTFGRKWTYLLDGGHTIMNSERNAWNSDSSLFFLNDKSGSNYRQIVLFDGKTANHVKTVTVSNLPATKSTVATLRWMPGDPDKFFYLHSNKIYTYSLETGQQEIYQELASFSLTEKDPAGGDGNEVAPNGDFLIGNKGVDCFVYNFYDKKVVRIQDNQRFYFDPTQAFPTINLGTIDYAIAFAGFIVELNEDGGGTQLRNYNGSVVQQLYRRTPHMDPTYFMHNDTLYPGIALRYNDADASFYNGKGLPSTPKVAYFHGWDSENPSRFVRFELDTWPSENLGSGGQVSSNRYTGTSGILCQHGPALYDLPWEARTGECMERPLYDEDAKMPRRFAHHYIAYSEKYSSSSYQPEGWLSPTGDFAIIKTYWGWYKVDLSIPRMSSSEVETYLNSTPPATWSITVTNGTGDADCIEGITRTITADPPSHGMVFDVWKGDVELLADSTKASSSFTMPAENVSFTATYKELPGYDLFVDLDGSGTVSLNPSGGRYIQGTVVALTAEPGSGVNFVKWIGDLETSINPAVVLVDSVIHVTAVFSDGVNTDISLPGDIGKFDFSVSPNPASSNARLSFVLPGAGTLEVDVFSISGQKIKSVYSNSVLEGNKTIDWNINPSHFPPGFYFLASRFENESMVRKILVR